MRIDDNAEALAMMNRALGSLEGKIREAYNKGYQDGLKHMPDTFVADGIRFYKIKDEPNSSEKPNNCEKDCFLCKWLGDVDVCGRCRNRNLFAEADTEPKSKTEPTCSKMEQVDKDTNVRSKDEPQTALETMSCEECKHKPIGAEICDNPCHYEPQTERSK